MTKIEQMNLLNANEITDLWISFDLVNSIHYVAETFKSNVQDETIKSLVELWYSKSKEHMDKIVSIFKQENIPHSQGITQEDVNLNIPRLFSDKFYLFYAKLMSQAALSAHCRSFTMATRSDIRQLYSEFVDDLQYMDEQLTQVLNSTGLYTPPIVPYPESITFVKQQSFLAGFFTEKRSLTVMEVRHLFQNALSNALGKALLTGFMQVVQAPKLKDYLVRGQKMANEYYDTFTDILRNEDIAIPSTLDGEVTASTESPFSDKLIMSHASLLIPIGFDNFGRALTMVRRRDLTATLAKMMVAVSAYAEDGVNLSIEMGWLEQPPLALDRKELQK